MTQETIQALSDTELLKVIAWGKHEQEIRAEKRKQETIAKIRELARSIEVGVKIEGTRGRPRHHSDKKELKQAHTNPHSVSDRHTIAKGLRRSYYKA